MNIFLQRRKQLVLIFTILIIVLNAGSVYAWDTLKIIKVPLKVKHQNLSFRKLLSEPTYQIVSTQKFIVFNTHRKIWIKLPGGQLQMLSDLVQFPQECNWFQSICAIGDRFVIAVSNYTEERRQKDLATSRGGYREGPRAVGIMVVDLNPPKSKLIKEFKVVKRGPSALNISHDTMIPDSITLGMQSCFWDGKNLYFGDYGCLAQVFLDVEEATPLEYDEMALNRRTLFKDGETLWVAEDEGGASGGDKEVG